jgi:hypothetical protein
MAFGAWRLGCGLASRTDAVQVDVVGYFGVVVPATQAAGVFFDVDGSKTHGSAALPADQVVTMTCLGTQAVKDLPVLGALSLSDPVVGQCAQDAVDAGQTNSQLSVSVNV